ncbi:putative transferase, protein kinase RLK-Pelle-RLCK-IV family [Rosa chinensis]|uniref:Putative transferase, protein kinase RLK-Pelle-RLCK-IV family n=1 Tax=Rosa chinensis TaxID=74649 RepID=A0A2P6SMD1_ROSCH|nr:putative transferase, protein kinase RLK-Pelle-RLCK-IV family [Rosa chinensis]
MDYCEEEREDMELPLFDFTTIADATDNFSSNNKLGQGGFGPVYKGTLIGGKEIAVKRRSKESGQGMREFKNEACGFIPRDHEGKPIVDVSKNGGRASVPMVEALALRDGLQHTTRKGVRKLQVEGDSKLVIDAITKKFSPPWRIQQIIEDIHNIASKFEDITFKHIFREPNFTAVACAHLGLNCNREKSWEPWLPSRIARAVHFDNLGHAFSIMGWSQLKLGLLEPIEIGLNYAHHRNLVSLIGYCDEGDTMALVFEYVANGNLQQHLSGLDYLHNGCKPPIVHRGLKASNILLNEKLQAKIADLVFLKFLQLKAPLIYQLMPKEHP